MRAHIGDQLVVESPATGATGREALTHMSRLGPEANARSGC